MPSFPSLHDALSSLLPGRGGHDWMLRPGMPGFGDGIDSDDRPGDPARGPLASDIDADAVPRPHHLSHDGHGQMRQGYADSDVAPQVAWAVADGMRGPPTQPLSPPVHGQLEPSLQALARELQQLPPSVIRQLSDALSGNPGALRDLPARPEALATVLARTSPEPGSVAHPATAATRGLAHAAERENPVARGHDADAMRESRQPASAGTVADARGVDARAGMALADATRQGQATDTRPAGAAAGMDPALAAAVPSRAQGPGADVQTMPAGPQRADTSLPTPAPGTHAHTTAAPGTTHVATGATASAQDGMPWPGGRADVAGTTADRGAQGPGLGGLGGVAAGITLAAVANPAGTTHAYAPDSAVRASRVRKNRDQLQQGRSETPDHGSADEQADGQKKGQRTGTPTSQAGAGAMEAGNAAERPAATRAQGETSIAGHTAQRGGALRQADSLFAAADEHPSSNQDAQQSRRQQWLYWSLIALTYGCLGLALATVAPGLFSLPIAAEASGTWRNALTGTGLLTGLWAWLLARRMR
ncbi:hypothetical protein ACW5EG_02290 [Luteimonas sp. A611]